MNAIVGILSRFGPGRLAAMGAVTLALVGFFAFVILKMSQPPMGVLYSDLSPNDAGTILKELDTRGVKYESRDDGTTILAPKSDLARLRMDLAAKALPSGGGIGYEIFDKGDAFSTTSFVQGINQLRALEGELSRTIRSLGRVQAARVHLAIPERRLFERDREPPRASIVLKTRGEMGSDQVQAIRHLVASAVQGMKPENVSIVDERGRLLAGAGSGEMSALGAAGDDRRTALERRLRQQIEEIVTGIVGSGRSRVQVAADLDLNRIESRSENYDPEGRVVRSSQTRGENSATASTEGQVTVGNELPATRDQAAAAPAPRDSSNKTEEVVNYEISRTTRTEVTEAGRLKRLSVAVLVDGAYVKGPNGELAYQPRKQEELDRIGALVRSAIGFDKARGDQVEVVNLPFAEPPTPIQTEQGSFLSSLVSFTKDDLVRFVELGVISLLTLIVLMAVVRPMVRRVIAPDQGFDGLALAGGDVAALAGPSGAVGQIASQQGEALAQIAGGGHASAPASAGFALHDGFAPLAVPVDQIARLGSLASTRPKEAASVIRGWMNEG